MESRRPLVKLICEKLSGGDERFAHLRAGDVQRGVSVRVNPRITRLRACGGQAKMRAKNGTFIYPPVRVQRTYFDVEHSGQKDSSLACGWFWIRSTSS